MEQPNLLPNLPLHYCLYYEGSNIYGILRTRWSNHNEKKSNLFFLHCYIRCVCMVLPEHFTPKIFLYEKGLNIMKININQYRLRKRPKLAIQRLWSFLATNLNSVIESNFESIKSSTYLFKAIKNLSYVQYTYRIYTFMPYSPWFFVIF